MSIVKDLETYSGRKDRNVTEMLKMFVLSYYHYLIGTATTWKNYS